MNQQAKKKQSKNEDAQPYRFSDEATQNKIKKHLTDIKDVITEGYRQCEGTGQGK